jgi:hypothetical protein
MAYSQNNTVSQGSGNQGLFSSSLFPNAKINPSNLGAGLNINTPSSSPVGSPLNTQTNQGLKGSVSGLLGTAGNLVGNTGNFFSNLWNGTSGGYTPLAGFGTSTSQPTSTAQTQNTGTTQTGGTSGGTSGLINLQGGGQTTNAGQIPTTRPKRQLFSQHQPIWDMVIRLRERETLGRLPLPESFSRIKIARVE